MIGTARAPGTCGELVQGITEGVNFLVTCPVDMYSVVTVKLDKSGVIRAAADLPKVRLAVEKVLRFFDAGEMGAEVLVSSSLPRGKGMASSTADISAACAAAAAALGTFLTPSEIAEIALSIEPTDGIMFPGITMFDHVQGKLARVLGPAPELEAFIVDLGGTVDTIGFNANFDLELKNREKEDKVDQALKKLERAISQADCRLAGEAATESAFANQHILCKPRLDRLLEICREAGGVGISAAHSGTVVGLLFEANRKPACDVASILAGEGFHNIFRTRLIDGGVQVLRESAGDKVWQSLSTYTGGTYGRLRKNTG
ncbi:MAG: GHMP kinase [Eubacteriales bacterium]